MADEPRPKKELARYWWGTWSERAYGTLGEVVALACDLDPSADQTLDLLELEMSLLNGASVQVAEQMHPRPSSKDTDLVDRWSRFSELLREAFIATKIGDILIRGEYVRLLDLARWAEKHEPPFRLPPQFPGQDKRSPPPAMSAKSTGPVDVPPYADPVADKDKKTDPAAPHAGPHREPIPGFVNLDDEELSKALLGWSHVEPKKPPAPDWDTWRHLPDCELWQAVLLSLNFDPGYFVLYDDGAGKLFPLPPEAHRLPPQVALHKLLFETDKKEIERRLMIAVAQLARRSSSRDLEAHNRRLLAIVPLPEFGAWAAAVWTDLPREFPGTPGEMDQEAPQSTVQLPHMTRTLSTLFDIMRKHWTNYDAENPPKQTVIASEIGKALGWSAQKDGKPSRGADTLAAAIRPDELVDADPRARGRRGKS